MLSFVRFTITLIVIVAQGALAKKIDGASGGTAGQSNGLRYGPTQCVDSQGIVRALFNIITPSLDGAPEEIARQFLHQKKSALAIPDTAALVTHMVQTTPSGSHVRFTQFYQGVPVYQGDVVVSVNEARQVGMVINNYKNGIGLGTTTPSLSGTDAINIVRRALRINGRSIGKEDAAELMVFQKEDGAYHLSWRVTATSEDPAGDWEVFVGAETGEILNIADQFVMHVDSIYVQGSAYVYNPDPLSKARRMYNSPGFADGNDATTDSLNAYRTLVTLEIVTYEDGVYKLKGPHCNVTDIESPADPPFYCAATPHDFLYSRDQQEFEAVNVYYHVSSSYRHLLDLGFSSASLEQIRLDPHGFQGQDNSHYSPSGNWISWGEGGVDDAEDADVILHEYGHAINHNFVPTWGGGESGALGEGFGDYWAASYSRSMNQWEPSDYHYNWVFNWDGHNPFWVGRVLNDTRTYPFGSLPIHTAGQIWSAALMGIWGDLGREITDRLVLKGLLYLGSNATAPLAAMAIIQADRDLYGGVHVPTLVYWLGTVKHFIDPESVADVGVYVGELPTEFALAQNYPNPFNPSTAIQFTLQATAQVSLSVYNTVGQEIATLVAGIFPPGRHNVMWHGIDRNGKSVGSGVYFYRLATQISTSSSGNFVQTKKMSLLR